jgi:hypothetical chaperone protein
MAEKTYGVDFGTTNSAISLWEGGQINVLPIAANGKQSMRSVLFFPRDDRNYYAGDEAVRQYIESGMEGRLIQSIKSFLSDASFTGTVIRGRNYSIEDLVVMVLRGIKERADRITGDSVQRAVLGRPARFSDNGQNDALAQTRLLQAAENAGFREVHLQLEPIAAAYSYERTLEKSELVLVADFGGGTSDFALIMLGPDRKGRVERASDVLGTLGVTIGGDNLDSEIMRHKLLCYFGSEIHYESANKMLPMPAHLMGLLCEWRMISSLKDTRYKEFISSLRRNADDPDAAERLYALIDEDLGFALFQKIENTKQALSTQ